MLANVINYEINLSSSFIIEPRNIYVVVNVSANRADEIMSGCQFVKINGRADA